MSDDTLHDEFMKLGDMTEIDNRILAGAGEDNLIDRMQEEKEKRVETRTPWMQEVKANWFSYSILALSFLLTEMLALYLGLSPEKRANPDGSTYLYFHTDFPHIMTALVYMLVFPIVTEAAFAVSRKKFEDRETGNFLQGLTMGIAIAAGLISIVGTGVAGGYVVLSTIGSIGFLEVPPSAKTWLVWVIPSLLALFALLHGVYASSSKLAKAKKLVEEKDRNDELTDMLRTREIERAGKRAFKAAAIRSFEKSVSMGLLSQQEADIALSQGKSVSQLERELNRDLTGEGKIGDTSGLFKAPSLPAPREIPPPVNGNGKSF